MLSLVVQLIKKKFVGSPLKRDTTIPTESSLAKRRSLKHLLENQVCSKPDPDLVGSRLSFRMPVNLYNWMELDRLEQGESRNEWVSESICLFYKEHLVNSPAIHVEIEGIDPDVAKEVASRNFYDMLNTGLSDFRGVDKESLAVRFTKKSSSRNYLSLMVGIIRDYGDGPVPKNLRTKVVCSCIMWRVFSRKPNVLD